MTDANTAVPTTRIDCRTPDPSTSSDIEHFGFGVDNPSTNPTVLTLPDSDYVDSRITSTGTLGQLEELLHLGRNYYDGIFGNPQWRDKEPTFVLDSLEKFYHHILDGPWFLERECVAAAFENFDRACGQVHGILKQKTPLFFPYLYYISIVVQRKTTRALEIQSRLLNFISHMAKSCSTELRPIQESLAIITKLPFDDKNEALLRVFRSLSTHIQVQFEVDAPDDIELEIDLCSLARFNSSLLHETNNYKLTSINPYETRRLGSQGLSLVAGPRAVL
jgi:hypothetical protein